MSLIVPLSPPKLREDESRLPAPITKRDPATFEDYVRDASNFRGSAETVFIPFSEKQISDFLKACSSRKIPVTVEGAHTGLVGGGVPQGGCALSLEKLTRISEIQNGVIRVDAGVPLGDLQRFVESKGFLYPPDPTERTAQIGATVATNASGPRTFKYGSTRPWVRRLRVVLATGDVLDLERGSKGVRSAGRSLSFEVPSYVTPDTKCVAGYYARPGMDLIDLFIGSEGTLGVITELELSLIQAPEKFVSLVAFFKTEEDAVRFVIEAREESRSHGKVEARALEYLDSFSLRMLETKFPQIPREANAAIFLEQETEVKNEEKVLEAWLSLIQQFGGLSDKSWAGLDHKMQNEIKDFRHELPVMVGELMARQGLRKVGNDMAVPDAHLEALLKFYKESIREAGIDSVTFGHIGNNHLHVNLLPKTDEEFYRAWLLYRRWVVEVVRWGGTVSAEHGIGKIKVPLLEMMYPSRAIGEMIRLKRALDPAEILGRGNIFREELLGADLLFRA